MIHLDRAMWYSGWDGEIMAEIIPASYGWFVVLLGQGLFATSDRCYLGSGVLPLLTNSGFGLERAVWSSLGSPAYGSNPFLSKAPLHQCLNLASLTHGALPVNYEDYPLQNFHERRNTSPVRSSLLAFVVTLDYQFVRWGRTRFPDRYLLQLQKQSPQTLLLLGTLKDQGQSKEIEHRFHHHRRQGSWYYYAPELATYLGERLNPIG